MAKVLFLPSWYPSRVDAFDGDFIERHAQSISLYNQVIVIYVKKDPGMTGGKDVIEKESSPNRVTYRAYYPSSQKGWFSKFHSTLHSFRLFKRVYRQVVLDHGKPDIVHLNVLMKAGLFAWWLRKKYEIPYVLSENWTGYYPERKDGYRQQNTLYRFLSRRVYKHCNYPLPVTRDLGEKMNALLGEKDFRVIPNVVNTLLFYPVPEHRMAVKRFFHASTLGYHKNIMGILRTAKKLFETRQDFELYLSGSPSAEILQWSRENGLMDSCINFTGLIPYPQVAEYMRNSDALVMFSRYENLPCVILEALACGLPVISTDVGGIREVIGMDNGILVPSEKEDDLLDAMSYLLDNLDQYDRQKIAFSAKNKFSYEVVGRQFDESYHEVWAGENRR
jgi:glycosyltransferase involved in cell wall biosynthesis